MGIDGLKPAEAVQAAAIARRYFIDDVAKKDIATEFGISRFKVARLLDRARESGLVTIEINLPAQIDADVSERLRRAYGLRHAIVISTPDEPDEILRRHLGEVAAQLLTELVEAGDVLGIGWGRTINAMTGALADLAPCTVVQLTGAVGTVVLNESSVEIVRRVAQVAGGPAYPIFAPLIVDSGTTAAAIRRQPQVALAMRQFERLTKAMISIGSWDPPNSQILDSMTEEERRSLLAAGVRAEFCATFLNDAGRPVADDLVERSIAITAEQLRRVPEVIGVAGGRRKALAIRAVLGGHYVTSLVTDLAAASALLANAPSEATSGRGAPENVASPVARPTPVGA